MKTSEPALLAPKVVVTGLLTFMLLSDNAAQAQAPTEEEIKALERQIEQQEKEAAAEKKRKADAEARRKAEELQQIQLENQKQLEEEKRQAEELEQQQLLESMAEFKVCNQSAVLVYVAKAEPWFGQWRSEGWWRVEPGNCQVLWNGPFDKIFYYVFANNDAGAEYRGDYPFCTRQDRFTIVDNQCGEGFERKFFNKFDMTNQSSGFTFNLY